MKQVNINDRWYEPLARAHGDKLELLLAESLRVAHATGALKTGDLKRITVDTTGAKRPEGALGRASAPPPTSEINLWMAWPGGASSSYGSSWPR